MSKTCAKCEKSVYPLEELKCLDKVWHKATCFKCTECGMILNMKTYKGFNKLPYCEAHIPKAKATTVAETPELRRIQENTKIQSNAAYHADFEKSKGKFTPVVDDPELMRIKQNSKIISNAAYHGDFERKAKMEQQRTLTEGGGGDQNSNGIAPPRSPSYMDELSSVPTPQPPPPQSQQQRYGQPTTTNSSYRPNSYNSGDSGQNSRPRQNIMAPPMNQPVTGNPSPYSTRTPNVVYSSDGSGVNSNASRKVGSIADYDPVNNYYGSLDPQPGGQMSRGGNRTSAPTTAGYNQGMHQQSYGHQQQHSHQPPPPQQTRGQQGGQGSGICYRALYDYEAQDMDEVSFGDGDLIIDCTAVDEGWMTGTVQRTGRRGMLPANYVVSQ